MKNRRMEPGKSYVLQYGGYRTVDGKKEPLYLEVWGMGVEWNPGPTVACPIFTKENVGPNRKDDFHFDLWRRNGGSSVVEVDPKTFKVLDFRPGRKPRTL